jgi:zinc protease
VKKKIFLLLVLLTIFSASGWGQTNPTLPIPVDPEVRIGKLQNGLTYYIRKNSKPENKAEFRLVIKAGSILERDDQQGYAHFLEHMAFNGTRNFKKNELVSYLQSIGIQFGAHLNAYTSFDETVYLLSIPTEKKELIDKGLLILQDWASSFTLDPEEVKREQGVVLEELRLGQGAGQRLMEKYLPKLYYNSQYAKRLPIGKKELLEKVNYQALVDFYEDWYRPDLMALVVVGDVDVDEIEAKIKENFSALQAKREIKPRPIFDVPDHRETFVVIETDPEAPVTSASLIFKKPGLKQKNQTDLREQLVRSFFNGMLNDRLSEISKSPNPPFIGAGGGFSAMARGKDSFTLSGNTNPEGLKQTISTLLLENKRVKEFGFTPAELERAKEGYLVGLENLFQERNKLESSSFAAEYVNNFLIESPIPGLDFWYQFGRQTVPSISLAEINALAKNTITEDNRVIIVTGPPKEGVKYPTQEELLGLIKESETAKVTPYTETVITEPLVKDLPASAKVIEEKVSPKFGLTSWILSNGVRVILKPTDFKSDEILMSAWSPGGMSLINNERACGGALLDIVVSESGLKKMSKVELDKLLANKAANVSTSIYELSEQVSGSSTPKDFETMLQLAYLKFTSVNFDKAVFDSIINKEKMFLPTLSANPQLYFSVETDKIMNQGNPRYCSLFDPATLEKANLDDIKAIYQDRFGDASDFTFIFVGNFENNKVKPLIEKYLGNLPGLRRTEKWKDTDFKTPFDQIEKVIKKGVDNRSTVKITFSGNAEYDRNESLHLSALGELLTIKLTEVLREEKAGVYGVGASGGMSKLPRGEYSFTISFSCGPENVENLIKAALDEVAKIQNGQIEDKDLGKVKQTRLVQIKESFKQNSYWSGLIENFVVYQEEIPSLEETQARINSINQADLQKVARKYLKPEHKKQFILMPEDKK